MIDPDAVEVFLIEAREVLESIEQSLLDLDGRLDDRQLVDSVFRGLHTLKGSGAMFGFTALAEFTHHCETAFDRVRKGEVIASRALVAAILSAQDHMRALIEDPEGDHGAASEVLLEALNAAVGEPQTALPPSASTADATPAPLAPSPEHRTFIIRFSLPANALVNGVKPMGFLNELRELGVCTVEASTDKVPALEALNPTECHLRWTVVLTTDQSRDAIEDVFIFVMDEMVLEIEERPGAGEGALGASASGELAPTALAAPPVSTPSPLAEHASPERTSPERILPERILPERAPPAERAPEAAEGAPLRVSESVRVPAERLDELMDRVGELVIAQSRLRQLATGSLDLQLRSVSEEIERLSNELRSTTMVLRMVPIGSLFARFRRLTHDLSRETGKAIELTCEGETTEVDKTVVERLADPLVHLVRNAADHGLETPQERRAAGKPETGKVRLSARQSGGEVIIALKDDGRGINRERVRARAESQGLLEPGAVISDTELMLMIFQPGFSTAQQVTNLSGRGVGMDVVKRTVEALRGSIDVVSKPGEGSEFSLRIPLTLAIIDGLLVRVGQGRYVIPLSAVEECLELSLEEDLRSSSRSFIALRDGLVPFLRLRELFDTGTPPELHQKVVVIAFGGERIGLVVDQIIGDHQTVIKSLSKLHAEVATFSGATILGDGGVALILDVPNLVAAGQRREAQLRAAG
jgi:two-component system chemotaxis sensor kinase CheA